MSKKYIWICLAFFSVATAGLGIGRFYLRPVVHLAYMSDSKYLPYVMVSIYSALKNKKKETRYQVHVIAQNFNPNDIAALKSLETQHLAIKVYPIAEHSLNIAHLGRFASFKISLQKIFLADYMPKIDKVLYLDADTLVQKDLTSVYNTNLSDLYAAAVKDGLMYQFPAHIDEIGLKWRNFYFNSGVMLLNLKEMRKDKVTQQAVVYFNTHNEIFGDQDILNVVFDRKVMPLSYLYNCNSTFFEEKDAAFLSAFWQETVLPTPREVYDAAAILHFAGHKPWTPWFTHPYLKPLWWQYANEVKAKYHISF